MQTIENYARSYISLDRFNHTLCVANEARKIGALLGLSDTETDELYIAGLLHDVTKEFNFEKQLELAKELSISLTCDDLSSPAVLHARTGAYFAKRDFPMLSERIFDAIYCHTTGKEQMSLFDKILYLADYIEPGRKHESCISVRKYFYDEILSSDNKPLTLDKTLLLSYTFTIEYLVKNNRYIHIDTVKSRNDIIKTY